VLCRISRWKLSGAIDSGKPLSGTVRRHLLQCVSCREFARLAEDTGRRLTRDADALVESFDQSLAKTVQASLGDRAESPTSRPEVNRRPPDAPTKKSGNWGIDNLVPILAAAAAVVVVGASVLWVVGTGPRHAPDLMPPFRLEKPGPYLVAAVEKVNSPYEKEMRLWKETLDGAAEQLKAVFDIRLGEAQ
jgi:hypothetical protein